MRGRPLVSIIIPCYNHAGYIEKTLASIAQQSYRPLELIVIDDGSTDHSGRIAREFIEKHLPWAQFIERPNRGAAETLNQGILLSSGDFITFLNSDDLYLPGRIERLVEASTLSGRGLVFTDAFFIDDFDKKIEAQDNDYVKALVRAKETIKDAPSLGFALLRIQLAISTGNLFFSRSLLQQIGFFRNYRYVHDWDMLLRSLFFEEPMFLANEPLYGYRIHESNSYKTLGSIANYETTEVMRNLLVQMTSSVPLNSRAPSPYLWGVRFLYVRSEEQI